MPKQMRKKTSPRRRVARKPVPARKAVRTRAAATGSAGVDAYVAKLKPPMHDLVAALRWLVMDAAPGIQETIKWGMPWFGARSTNMRDALCYIKANARHITFGFRTGKGLSDPDGLLEGVGKGMRHVKIRSTADIRPELFAAWVREAMGLTVAGAAL
jgi:hypothetical protein